jgi:hypothetical protein
MRKKKRKSDDLDVCFLLWNHSLLQLTKSRTGNRRRWENWKKNTHAHCWRNSTTFERNRVTCLLGMFAPHHCEKRRRNKMVTIYTVTRQKKTTTSIRKGKRVFCFSWSINRYMCACVYMKKSLHCCKSNYN